jgi:hypothetical protein
MGSAGISFFRFFGSGLSYIYFISFSLLTVFGYLDFDFFVAGF